MTVQRVVVTGCGLWFAAQVVGGVQLTTPGDPLVTIGTVLMVALVLGVLQGLSRGPRRVVALVLQRLSRQPLPLALVAAAAINAGVFWLAARLATAVGLQYTVDGYRSALLGSLVVVLVGWVAQNLAPARS